MDGNILEQPPAHEGVCAHRGSWSERYGQRHHLQWIKDFPSGIAGPKKVRIYRVPTTLYSNGGIGPKDATSASGSTAICWPP